MKRLAKKCIKTSFFAIIEAFLNGLTIICYFWYFLQPWILKLQHKTRLFLQYQMFWTVLTSLIYTLKIGVFKCDVNKKLPFFVLFFKFKFYTRKFGFKNILWCKYFQKYYPNILVPANKLFERIYSKNNMTIYQTCFQPNYWFTRF